ncbi:hypothetical protein COCNU_06G010780 [Cocos nucifera]|uniref:Bulb-type lectin domain-containing protein n=1 Tax=Cocos nucifera TaxID=13894 RepID=A0A8K0IBM2_COCNU|nr:hypothetical protein COCNU_06G010780 [Cocos nucifera]
MASSCLLHHHLLLLQIIVLILGPTCAQTITYRNISLGTSLAARTGRPTTWLSPSGDFAFGFRPLEADGTHFLLAIWFDKIDSKTAVWCANRNTPVQVGAKVVLATDGQLSLYDRDHQEVWNAKVNVTVTYAAMLNNGNFILASSDGVPITSSRESSGMELELNLFDMFTIESATDNFSVNNKLGEGGFGPVYKGRLDDGQEIAVKRLSKDSVQGLKEFKNEVWRLWENGTCVELLDEAMGYSYPISKLVRCIQVGLLCVQEGSKDRPTMAEVVLMLSNEGVALQKPKRPGFCIEISLTKQDSSSSQQNSITPNEVTVTVLEGR